MNINIILPFRYRTGGVLMVAQYAYKLEKNGHRVSVYYPLIPYLALFRSKEKNILMALFNGYLRSLIMNFLKLPRQLKIHLGAIPLKPVLYISNKYISDGDVLIATAWPTANSIYMMEKSKGNKIYFVQDYEIWNADPRVVDATFKLGLKMVTISPWLTELIKEKSGKEMISEVWNGVDTNFFTPPKVKEWKKPSILLVYRSSSYKGWDVGCALIAELKKWDTNVIINVFGFDNKPKDLGFVNYNRNPSLSEIKKMYQTATIFVSTSRREGWGLPILEAMACGCAVVATNTGCVSLLEKRKCLVSINIDDLNSLVKSVKSLIINPKLCQKYGQLGLEASKDFDVVKSSQKFESVLMN